MSPSSLIGPRRFFPPPLALEDLPPLDAIMTSHDHYDHLDRSVIRALVKRPTQVAARFVVPLGVGAHLEQWGVSAERITELDWGEATTVGPLTLTATPARHFSGRGLFDRNHTLWASWSVNGPVHRVFHSGDSGPFSGFSDIGMQPRALRSDARENRGLRRFMAGHSPDPGTGCRCTPQTSREGSSADSLGHLQSCVSPLG